MPVLTTGTSWTGTRSSTAARALTSSSSGRGVPEDESFRGARLIGGDGHDSFRWAMAWPMHLNARTGRVTSKGSVAGTGSDDDTEAAFRGIETFSGSGLDDVMIGHRGRDDFQGTGGDDVLIGRGGRDLLVGGPGRDKATGGAGVDTCRAEQRLSCERR